MTLSDSITYDYVFLGLGCGNGLMLLQLEAEGLLTNKRIKRLWSQSAVRILWLRFWAQCGVRLVHQLSLPLWGQKLQGRADQSRRIRIGRFTCGLGHSTSRIAGRIAKIAKRRERL